MKLMSAKVEFEGGSVARNRQRPLKQGVPSENG